MIDFLKVDLSNRKTGLDILRTFAILLVLYYHSDYFVYDLLPNKLANIFHWSGYIGVDIFFVLSGFLIGGHLLNIDINYSNLRFFLIKRWFRTLPNYYLMLLIYIAVWILFRGTNYLIGNGINENVKMEDKNDLIGFFFFVQSITAPESSFFVQSWSLCVEELAYLILPLFLILNSLYSKLSFIKITFILFFIAFLIKIALFFFTSVTHIFILYRLCSIFSGVFFASLYIKFKPYFEANSLKFLYLSILFFFFSFLNYYLIDITVQRSFSSLLTSLLLLFSFAFSLPFFNTLHFKNKFLEKICVVLSVISYSLYLNHFLILLFIESIRMRFPEVPWIAYYFSFYIFSILISILQYKYFEKPFINYRLKFSPR